MNFWENTAQPKAHLFFVALTSSRPARSPLCRDVSRYLEHEGLT